MNPAVPPAEDHDLATVLNAFPAHIAIIMDGNGRWAEARGLPRAAGHERGVVALRKTVEAAQKLPLKYLTVYSFSTENWKRPKEEIHALFALLKAYVKQDLARLKKEGVQIRVLGSRAGLPRDIDALITKAETQTAGNSDFILCIAFNYGGREDVVQAARQLAEKVYTGDISVDDIDEARLSGALYTSGIPDPDMLIRTGNEYRISNFLLWQCAYAEFIVMDVLWPDFDGDHLDRAVSLYQTRERRFGGLKMENDER